MEKKDGVLVRIPIGKTNDKPEIRKQNEYKDKPESFLAASVENFVIQRGILTGET